MKSVILIIGACMLISTISSANGINKELNKLNDTVQDIEGNTYRTVKNWVLTKTAFFYHLFHIPMGGTDHPEEVRSITEAMLGKRAGRFIWYPI